MSLPACQQRVLDRMEGALRASEPQLTSMYAIFSRLNAGEPVARERLVRKRMRWLQQGTAMYAVVLVPVMFAAIIVGALLGGNARSATTCEASYSVGGISPLTAKPSCPASGKAAMARNAARKVITARLACPKGSPPWLSALTGRDLVFPSAARVVASTAAAGPPGIC